MKLPTPGGETRIPAGNARNAPFNGISLVDSAVRPHPPSCKNPNAIALGQWPEQSHLKGRVVLKGHDFSRAVKQPGNFWALAPEGWFRFIENVPQRLKPAEESHVLKGHGFSRALSKHGILLQSRKSVSFSPHSRIQMRLPSANGPYHFPLTPFCVTLAAMGSKDKGRKEVKKAPKPKPKPEPSQKREGFTPAPPK